MGYSVYFSDKNNRWQGYGVPAYCDHPGCKNEIDRGMGYVCCDNQDHTASCGGFYCEEHKYLLIYQDDLENMSDEELKQLGIDSREEQARDEDDGIICCAHKPIEFKELPSWLKHVLTDDSWEEWRNEEPESVKKYQALLDDQTSGGSQKL